MLKSMEELLKGDYNVSVANSGLSVIRCISLDRPDLIILDYDMPVCNGAQTLEMIRSEKDFANIPVIFLTGRSDREAVEKIIPLKPEGYMVKNMPPEDIKKNAKNQYRAKAIEYNMHYISTYGGSSYGYCKEVLQGSGRGNTYCYRYCIQLPWNFV